MPDIIRLLPDIVANQIAAGEVIQRPASVIKELLENSVDSGATDIKIIIKDAGKTLIQIIDNGCGMSVTDARLSFEKHATSKIRQVDDLYSIRTMGFRGEALASIAAIAQVELKTKRTGDELGTLIEIEGSEVKNQTPVSCVEGTSISVKNLFFNVPARRIFLKSNNAENNHIIEAFQRIALAYPQIDFSMYINDKIVFQLSKSSLKQRIVSIYGNQFNERLLIVEQETNQVNISGFIGKPEFAKKTRGEQFFFVNNRFIKHPYLHHSVENAFNQLLPSGSFPTYFIFLNIDPQTIDINIHPTKTEVNFQDSKLIYAILQSAVKQSLGKFSITPSIDFDIEQSFKTPTYLEKFPLKQPTITIDPNYNPFETKHSPPTPALSSSELSNKKNWEQLYKYFDNKQIDNESIKTDIYSHTKNIQADFENNIFKIENRSFFQLQNRYILCNIKSGLLIIDQQRAHERILFERFMNVFSEQQGSSQQLLFPQPINLSPLDTELVKDLMPYLKHIGFDIDEFGKNSFIINGTPTNFPEKNINDLIEKVLDNYKLNLVDLTIDKKINLANAMAKNLALKSGKYLDVKEMESLIDELFTCKAPNISLSGKPSLIILKTEEIDYKFK